MSTMTDATAEDKMICPACESYTSGVLLAYKAGRDCPVCGLPAAAATQMLEEELANLNARFDAAEPSERLEMLRKVFGG
jgi:hypothetical protein